VIADSDAWTLIHIVIVIGIVFVLAGTTHIVNAQPDAEAAQIPPVRPSSVRSYAPSDWLIWRAS
jgi:hypothetical protein